MSLYTTSDKKKAMEAAQILTGIFRDYPWNQTAENCWAKVIQVIYCKSCCGWEVHVIGDQPEDLSNNCPNQSCMGHIDTPLSGGNLRIYFQTEMEEPGTKQEIIYI